MTKSIPDLSQADMQALEDFDRARKKANQVPLPPLSYRDGNGNMFHLLSASYDPEFKCFKCIRAVDEKRVVLFADSLYWRDKPLLQVPNIHTIL